MPRPRNVDLLYAPSLLWPVTFLGVSLALIYGPASWARAAAVDVPDAATLVSLLLRPHAPRASYRIAPDLIRQAELDADGLHIRNGLLLSKLTFLRTLSLRRARVPSFDFPRAMPLLERLDLSVTTIRSLDGLRGARGLRELDLSDTRVTDLRPLAGLAQLTILDLSGTRVTDFGPLVGRHLTRLMLGAPGAWVLPDLRPLAHVDTLVLRGTSPGLDLGPLRHVRVTVLALDGLVRPRLVALANHPTLDRLVLDGTRVDLAPLRSLLRRSPRLQVVMPDGRLVGRVPVFRKVPPDPRDYPCLVGTGPCASERFAPRREVRYRFVLP